MQRNHAIRLVSTKAMSRDEWLAVRNQGIGSSDSAAVVGLSPYKSPLELWMEKTGRKAPDDLSANEAVFWGSTLEPVIAQVYGEKTGAKVRRVHAVLQHYEHPHMLANLDRIVAHPQDGHGILEVKTAGHWSEGYWEEGVPEHYQCQVLHQLAVTGKPWADVAVLIGGQEFRTYRIERDEEKINALIELEDRFWQHVQNDTPPEVDGSESSGKALSLLYPSDNGEAIDFSDSAEMNTLFQRLIQARKERERIELEEATLKQQVQSAIGFTSNAIFSTGKVGWKKIKGSSATDFKQLAEEHPDLVAQYTVQKAGYRRFTVQVGK